MAGVSFTKDGEEGWTPVKRRRRSRVSDSNDEIRLPEGASITYNMQVGGTPACALFRHQKDMWSLSNSIENEEERQGVLQILLFIMRVRQLYSS